MIASAVLFDLDNTLTPRRECVVAFASLFAADFREVLVPVGEAELAALLVEVDQGGYNRRRGADLVDRLVWRVAPSARALELHWQARFPLSVVLRAGVRALLLELRARGVALGCVTNGGALAQSAKLERLGLGGAFDVVLISDAVGCAKPDPRIFALAVERLGVPARETWFVGDHPANDVIGARRSGMHAVWLRDGSHAWPEGEAPAAVAVATFAELRALLLPSGA